MTAFVEASLSDSRSAGEILDRNPGIAGAGPYPALILGDTAAVERALQETPELVNTKGGPRDWEPLVYVCSSRFAHRQSARAGALLETARTLLRNGANPNAYDTPAEWPGNPLSCLYGATGLNDNPELGLALLEAGANPNVARKASSAGRVVSAPRARSSSASSIWPLYMARA